MTKHAAKKIGKDLIICVVCFMLVLLLNFALPRLLPGDPVAYLTGMDEEGMSAEKYQYYREALHLDEDVFSQFGFYIKDIFGGTLGYSYKKEMSVSSLIVPRLSATLQIVLPAILISSIIALVWGMSAGYRKKWLDAISTPINVIANTVPTFLLGMVFIILLCFKARLFPYTALNSRGVEPGTAAYFFDRLHHLILPVATLVIAMLPSRFLLVRNLTAKERDTKTVLYARQRGQNATRIQYGYIFKNIAPTYINMVGRSIGAAVGGAVVIETVFSIKGMGSLLMDAVYSLDYPLMQGILFVTALCALIAVIVTDIVCVVVDPKARQEEEV